MMQSDFLCFDSWSLELTFRQQAGMNAFETRNKDQHAIYIGVLALCIINCLEISAGEDFKYNLFINGKDISNPCWTPPQDFH